MSTSSHTTSASHDAQAILIEAIGRELLGGAADDYGVARKLTTAVRALIDARLSETAAASTQLRNICAALSEQAGESPFTREEWERVDKQTAVHIVEIARLKGALKQILGWREIDRNTLGDRLREIERIATEALSDEDISHG